jgi:hypothetical protein
VVQRPHVRVVLGDPEDQPGDLVLLPAKHAGTRGERVVLVAAPRWRPQGSVRPLAEVYRLAVALTTERGARALVLPGSLTLGPWPMDDVTRVALTVLLSTPTTARDVTIAVPTPAMLEIWAEALVREG